MYSKTLSALFVGVIFSQPIAGLFSCQTFKASGFAPKCCANINGQVGINCISAHQMGATDPTWECNAFVYNITGCCQTTGYKNPYNNITLDLCSTSLDP
ncbi:Uu.00g002430.m01.CDS01 [Anthostomella pinea]|uniref:Uu.00g002430.m01.CDS01 n=1 Tax=Anthostomella pinea TaxID=933095 RepID=A0AAI8VE92_9PEZI|nr:Uu.00g002430.m01.CDS01 [Anthostomella pinea]